LRDGRLSASDPDLSAADWIKRRIPTQYGGEHRAGRIEIPDVLLPAKKVLALWPTTAPVSTATLPDATIRKQPDRNLLAQWAASVITSELKMEDVTAPWVQANWVEATPGAYPTVAEAKEAIRAVLLPKRGRPPGV
jgi:hypothetical protein